MVSNNRLKVFSQVVCLVVFLVLIYILVSGFEIETLKSLAEEHRILGAVIFGTIMFGTTVVAPLTSLPLVPMLAPLLGPFTTGLASYIGWTLGAMVAFWIGRHLGQPFVAKYIDLSTIRKYEAYIRPEMGFIFIAVLHMVIPVDLFSYALGIFSSVSFRTYTLATMVGILWFSFAFAYMGDSLVSGNYVLLGCIGVASLLVLFFSYRYVRRQFKKH